jgi:transcription antitermination protein NusB
MLSRRLIRVKVMQALYAFFQTEDNDLPAAEKQLIRNIDRIYELYIWQLAFLVDLFSYFRQRADEAKQKFLPTQEDLHPSTRFIDNKLIAQLDDNRDFHKQIERFKVNWVDEKELFRVMYNDIRAGEEYKKYMGLEKSSYEEDRGILIKLIRAQFFPSELLQGFFEERNIHWVDDFDTAMLMVMKTLKLLNIKQDASAPLPGLYEDDEAETEDKEFARNLLRKTIFYSAEYAEIISARAKNWELERIAMLDIILMKMAIAELIQFPSIPVKVTLNEYIEISKQYSTPKSKVFINGLLDKLIVEFKQEDKIRKTGRGLIDN